jgi:hypothetical protein
LDAFFAHPIRLSSLLSLPPFTNTRWQRNDQVTLFRSFALAPVVSHTFDMLSRSSGRVFATRMKMLYAPRLALITVAPPL